MPRYTLYKRGSSNNALELQTHLRELEIIIIDAEVPGMLLIESSEVALHQLLNRLKPGWTASIDLTYDVPLSERQIKN